MYFLICFLPLPLVFVTFNIFSCTDIDKAKQLSRIAKTERHRHYRYFKTVPTYSMLTKNVRSYSF